MTFPLKLKLKGKIIHQTKQLSRLALLYEGERSVQHVNREEELDYKTQ